jgi:hypothetical protein
VTTFALALLLLGSDSHRQPIARYEVVQAQFEDSGECSWGRVGLLLKGFPLLMVRKDFKSDETTYGELGDGSSGLWGEQVVVKLDRSRVTRMRRP